jgi:hypothetical protein
LKQKYNSFEVDKNLVNKHCTAMREIDSKIGEILSEPPSSACDWQTLYTHPKLMKSYFWRDRQIHRREQRVHDIKAALNINASYREKPLSVLSARRKLVKPLEKKIDGCLVSERKALLKPLSGK